jgi:hypothetical protein
MTSGSPLLAQPIATPSLSLSQGPPVNPFLSAENGSSTSTSSAEIPSLPGLATIYWGEPKTSVGPTEEPSTIEISASEPPRSLPASITNVGVQEITDAQTLRSIGYGVTLADAASYWKTHKPQAPRVYTNRDIDRLHGS